MKWILNQLSSTVLLPCSQVKNQSFLDCLPKAISCREPDWLDAKSKVSLESNLHSYLGKKLNNGSKMPSEWEEKKKKEKREPYCHHLPFPTGSNLKLIIREEGNWWGIDALGKPGQKLPSISKNWCSISVASLNNPISTAPPVRPWPHQCPGEDNTQQFIFSVSPVQGIDQILQRLAMVKTCSPSILQFSSSKQAQLILVKSPFALLFLQYCYGYL